ncbi:MAG TPA: efflux RND transporter periplasmic adaptor subunit [Rhabdaerophilum sp.]|nr:efflux RND transporter periplasmic adaptor subunit [Rhabdaerophilum sp.]
MTAGRILTLVALIGSVAGFLYWAFAPRAVQVEAATVNAGRFVALVEEDGKARVRERYTVSSPLPGRLIRVTLRPGDEVKEGEIVARLRSGLPALLDAPARKGLEEQVGAAEASLEEASLALERAKVLLDKARSDLDRTRRLSTTGAASAAQLDRDIYAHEAAQRDVGVAERRRDAASHALGQARAALARGGETEGDAIVIRSPVAGRVLRVLQESEAMVAASTAILEIGEPSDLEIAVDLLTTEAVRVRPGAEVTVTGWGGGKPLRGRVRRVEPSAFSKTSALGVEEQRVWVVIDIASPREEWGGLSDGFRVEVAIVVDDLAQALVVPIGALFRQGGDMHVFRIEGGKARLVKVELGLRSGKAATVISGLVAGDRVILYPPSSVKNGVAVSER